MHCLLCHEKIPRLRVWRTKSEFCCDEHAALYKKQTLERLLVDPSANQNGGQASLPEPPEPEDFEVEELVATAQAPRAPAPKGQGAHEDFQFWERFDRAEEAKEESVELPPPADAEAGEGIDELWRLADEVGRGQDSLRPGEVSRQTAEEALEALRQLANRTATGEPKAEEPPKVFEMPGRTEDDDGLGSLEDSSELDEVYREAGQDLGIDESSRSEAEETLWERPEAEEAVRPEPMGRRYVGEEPEDDSILDQLMADPMRSWAREPASAESRDAEDDTGENATPQETVSPSETTGAAASAESRADLDLEAPEPNWDFDDATTELSALKASLASTGAPPVTFEQEPDVIGDVDVSPVEPDWDELEALELADVGLEPPEPEVEDDEPPEASEKVIAFPSQREADDESTREPEPVEVKDSARRAAPTRFRPVLQLIEIEPDFEQSAGSDAFASIETGAEVIATDLGAQRYTPGWPSAIDPRGSRIRGRDNVLSAEVPAASGTNLSAPQDLLRQDEIAPPASVIFLPSGTGATSGQASDLSMHDDSVDIEPTAALDAPGSSGYAPQEFDGPFEPAGLFFDMTPGDAPARTAAESDEYEEGVAGAAAGRPKENL